MENDKKPFEYADNGDLQWLASKEDFVEFVWILVHYRNCADGRDDLANDEAEFSRQADLLGENLLSIFNPDISPYRTFYALRINTNPSFEFTAMTIRAVNRTQKDNSFLGDLAGQGVLPSYETMTRGILRWKKAEQLTCLLFPYMEFD